MAQQKFEFKEENHFLGFSNPSSNIKLDIGGQKKQTAVSWLTSQIGQYLEMNVKEAINIIEQAKQMEKEQMVDFAEFVATHIDKNKNYKGEMLHAKSKYDNAERTIDLLEQYYNETYNQ